MRSSLPFLIISLLVLSIPSVSNSQTIRTYSKQSEAEHGVDSSQAASVYIPGAPLPKQPKPRVSEAKKTSNQDSEKEDNGKEGSSRADSSVSIYGQYQDDDWEDYEQEDDWENDEGDNKEGSVKSSSNINLPYGGITPGKRDSVSHIVVEDGQNINPNMLTWVGLQPGISSNRTRVFLQTLRPNSSYRTEQVGNSFVVSIDQSDIYADNFGKDIDASFFNVAVTKIKIENIEDEVRTIISLRHPQTPIVKQEGRYLMIDFDDSKQ